MLEQGASLVLVDWLTSGRMSRGEGWDFTRLESRNEVMVQVRYLYIVLSETKLIDSTLYRRNYLYLKMLGQDSIFCVKESLVGTVRRRYYGHENCSHTH